METLVSIAIPLAVAIWVYKDATSHGITAETGKKVSRFAGNDPGVWALLVFLLLIIYLPMYLIFRNRLIAASKPAYISNAPEGQKSCPFCAELIKSAAKLCRHCGSKLA